MKIIRLAVFLGLICCAANAFGQNRIRQVDSFIREKMAAQHIPGLSLAVVRDGKVIFAKGYGMANLELSVPATEKTVYLIGSITKTLTAAATMMLIEEGIVKTFAGGKQDDGQFLKRETCVNV